MQKQTQPLNVLVVGGNFFNKGAQSMLFITVQEILSRYPHAQIKFATHEYYNSKEYTFERLYRTTTTELYALNQLKFSEQVYFYIKEFVKIFLKGQTNINQLSDLKKCLSNCDLIIDISGFAIGNKWSIDVQESYLNIIRLAKLYKVPVYLMPQSFGPFNYSDEKKYLLKELKDLLQYPNIIFARENEGKELLEQYFNLTNVSLSTDLVLQSKGVNLNNIYRYNKQSYNIPNIDTTNNVAIVPNMQCFRHGNKEKNFSIYSQIIDLLLQKGKTIYLVRHSVDDLEICKALKNRYLHQSDVILLENDFSCLEYDEFIKKFQFIICSRYHGVVHAYRNGTPAILLGWAVKYLELAQRVNQEQFSFDILNDKLEINKVIEAVNDMIANWEQYSHEINKHIKDIQQNNCFDILEQNFLNIGE
ncbi:polysaccharide pyruvyl transferase family protein [Streptococcus sp.]|uniref:polysaccharide pyruvyl transferase family protein n=1 Tax=Streptococcus sp. TaxID=1306 RepID=UPI003527A526